MTANSLRHNMPKLTLGKKQKSLIALYLFVKYIINNLKHNFKILNLKRN